MDELLERLIEKNEDYERIIDKIKRWLVKFFCCGLIYALLYDYYY